ncbi:MAG: ankyrin repeat domain-containing protein [Acidobacteria bacterium]|nr:ankyrin repeat domain-containing protein [Acidobacteriota bacterium]
MILHVTCVVSMARLRAVLSARQRRSRAGIFVCEMTMILALWLSVSPLIIAVRDRDHAAVRALIVKGADVNAPLGDGATALHWAVHVDDDALVTALLAAGARVDAPNDLGVTPLLLAAGNGNASIAAALLAAGANPNAASAAGVTPLMAAARVGAVDVATALLAKGAAVNAVEQGRSQSALMWAASRRHPAMVRLLLAHGADVHARTAVRPLTVMLDQGPRRIVKTSRQDAHRVESGGSSALHFAAQAGDVESAAMLLDAGAAIDAPSADGRSPLVLAVFDGQPTVARLLIARGANVNAAGAGYTALHAAVLRGDMDTVRALLDAGANVNARLVKGSPVRRFGSQWALPSTLSGATPLLVAAAYLEVEATQTLLAHGADVQLGLTDGTTPLLAAAGIAVQKEVRPIDLARWHMVDSDTPAVPRDEREVITIVTTLLDAGADVGGSTESGDTALHAAAAAQMLPLIQLLADRGAVLEAPNKAGQTPLDMTVPRTRDTEPRPAPTKAHDLLRKLGATR